MKLSEVPFLQKYLYYLVHIKGLLRGFKKVHYSQWGEDIIIAGLCKGNAGFFVDVGAFHPMHYSNTYLLYKRGWRGLNIDPNPRAKVLFDIHRSGDTTITSGVGAQASVETYYIFNHESCNTFSTAHRDAMLKRPFMKLIGEAQVPIRPLQSILDQYAPERPIGFLNIDVEGLNLDVLKSIDWSRVKPAVICVEDDDFDFSKIDGGSPTHLFLKERGYALDSRLGLSSLYRLGQVIPVP